MAGVSGLQNLASQRPNEGIKISTGESYHANATATWRGGNSDDGIAGCHA
jgi:hypothetical protein